MIKKLLKLTTLFFFICLMVLGLCMVINRKMTGEWPHLSGRASGKKIFYCSPRFSGDGRELIFIRVESDRKSEGTHAEIWSGDIQGHKKHKLIELPLKAYEEIFIDSFDKDNRRLVFTRQSFRDGARTLYRYDDSTGKCVAENIDGSARFSLAPPGGQASVTMYPADEKRGILSRLEMVNKEGRRDAIMTGNTTADSFTPAGWSGDLLLFHCHTPVNSICHNQLWSYSIKTGRLSMVAEDAENVLPSPAGGGVAYLVPLARTKQRTGDEPGDRWQLVVQGLGESGTIMSGKLNFSEDSELYSWSPDGKSLLFMKGNFLCLYDLESGSEKKLIDSEKEGWWGYPLSPYFVNWSADGRKLALLCYSAAGEKDKITEKVVIVAVNDGSRRVIHRQEIPRVKFSGEWSFHPHITWAPSGGSLVFEGRSPTSPQRTDITMVHEAGGEKKILSKGFLGFFDL